MPTKLGTVENGRKFSLGDFHENGNKTEICNKLRFLRNFKFCSYSANMIRLLKNETFNLVLKSKVKNDRFKLRDSL